MSLRGATCELIVGRWRGSPELAVRLLELGHLWDAEFGSWGPLVVVSIFRDLQEQEQLEREGRPAAHPSRSTHTSCPATGADLRLPVAVTPAGKLELGRLAQLVGLRWGGGSPLDAHGIPVDWNHVDLGPRAPPPATTAWR